MASSQHLNQTTSVYHLIFNPVAGSGDSDSKLVNIESNLDSLQNLIIHITREDLGANALAQRALQEGADVVIAAGGDGTVSGAAAALVGSDIPLGIIPAGTANSFATALGIPGDLAEACEVIKAAHCKRVDTARCNDRIMLLTTCIGFEADLLTEMDREEKSRFGKLAIVTNGLNQLKDVDQFDTTLETSDSDSSDPCWNKSATAITIANTATLNMVLAQGPAPIQADDGNLSVTVVNPKHRWDAITSAADLFLSGLQQRSVEDGTVHSHKASQVSVTTQPPQRVYVDGEPAGETPVTVKCQPRSLNVIVPNISEES